MKRKTYALVGVFLAVALGSSAVWNFYAGQASAQKSDESENFGVSEVINVQDAVENVEFIADSESLKFESIRKRQEDIKR